MTKTLALQKLRDIIIRKHLSLSTERSYLGWLVRFIRYLSDGHAKGLTSEQKLEAFLTQLAHQGISPSYPQYLFSVLNVKTRRPVGVDLRWGVAMLWKIL